MTTTEYMIAETTGGLPPRALGHCGSWYSDRYYTNDLRGAEAAAAAAERVAASAGGTYTVVEVRTFERPATPPVPYAAREVRPGWTLLYGESEREVVDVLPAGTRDGEAMLRIIFRDGTHANGEAYQTVYATSTGAVA